ncbi:hypothetical protein QJS04_geneDACA020731 [Acorus gramineus]|uniref:Uncharacterized protein n=1 Tax=Acorus gramineus TaxID=55184 RepID=A0AAV8ZZR9_ACOGR|nr:hypothetical protein QJS04_geneDACA020731 [Acorus gramineus]
MDLKKIVGVDDGLWTDEMHVSFLNWIEASFVRRMLGTAHDRGSSLDKVDDDAAFVSSRIRLDRYLPDSADSTFDSKRYCPARGGKKKKNVSGFALHCFCFT